MPTIKMYFPILCLSAVLLTSGCAAKHDQTGIPPIENLTSAPTQTPAVSAEESEVSLEPYHLTEDLKTATPSDPAFQMGSMTAWLGHTTVAELIEEGAELEPNGAISSLEFEVQPASEHVLTLSFQNAIFSVHAKNLSSQPSAIKNAVLTEIYADHKNLSAIGGIRPGNTTGDLTYTLGEPYQTIEGEEISGSYSSICAYCYTSRWDDKNIYFFVDTLRDTILSFQESLPVDYLYDVSLLPADIIQKLIQEQEQSVGEAILNSPRLLGVEGSKYAQPQLTDRQYTSVKLFTLNTIEDPDTFNKELFSFTDFVPNSYLIVEYEATAIYREKDQERLALIGQSLEPKYQVYGCFYILNPYFTDEGTIKSDIGASAYRDPEGVYSNREQMYEAIFEHLGQGYQMTDYSVTEKSLL